MADPRSNELWLEPLLDRSLAPVRAPRELQQRLWAARGAARRAARQADYRPASRQWLSGWMLASAAVFLAVLGSLVTHHSHEPRSGTEMALAALERAPDDLEFRSERVTDIRSWVKSRTGMDIPIPAGASQEIRLTGACGMKSGGPGVEVCYRVRGHNAALLVCKTVHAGETDGKHRFLKSEVVKGTRISSWTMRGQAYTLAYASHGSAADVREECLLCHAAAQQLTVSN